MSLHLPSALKPQQARLRLKHSSPSESLSKLLTQLPNSLAKQRVLLLQRLVSLKAWSSKLSPVQRQMLCLTSRSLPSERAAMNREQVRPNLGSRASSPNSNSDKLMSEPEQHLLPQLLLRALLGMAPVISLRPVLKTLLGGQKLPSNLKRSHHHSSSRKNRASSSNGTHRLHSLAPALHPLQPTPHPPAAQLPAEAQLDRPPTTALLSLAWSRTLLRSISGILPSLHLLLSLMVLLPVWFALPTHPPSQLLLCLLLQMQLCLLQTRCSHESSSSKHSNKAGSNNQSSCSSSTRSSFSRRR